MKISELSVDYVSFDDDDKEISAIAISYKDNSGKEQRRWLEKPRRIAHWKNVKRVLNTTWGECSNCNTANEAVTRYCPYCGAKMDEEESNNEQ